ncbi:DUF2867 domain-containing protein [Rhizobium sp. LEGMi198b]|uniref:DUF2867 domain-containing protein n=1 Tax=Rhizobium sp. CB3171 TaxID=3039157 RepID=UPI0032C2224B
MSGGGDDGRRFLLRVVVSELPQPSFVCLAIRWLCYFAESETADDKMPAKPIMVKPNMPHPALPGADWADCYELQVQESDFTAVAAARTMFGKFPFWVRSLLKLRDTVVSVFGLKSTGHHSLNTSETIGFFPIVSKSENQVVLGFDDKHLDFRVVIDVRDDGQGRRLIDITTLVKRKILLGQIYIAVITPFHRLIVETVLTDFGKRMGALSSPPSP